LDDWGRSRSSRYEEFGGDYFLRCDDQERVTERLVRQLERLGQRVTLEPATVDAR
jgi:hypothetical protein